MEGIEKKTLEYETPRLQKNVPDGLMKVDHVFYGQMTNIEWERLPAELLNQLDVVERVGHGGLHRPISTTSSFHQSFTAKAWSRSQFFLLSFFNQRSLGKTCVFL